MVIGYYLSLLLQNRQIENWGRWWSGEGKEIIIIRWPSLPRPTPPLPQDNSLGSRIRYFRRLQGVTRTQLATLTGYPVNTLANYEQNKIERPNPHILLKIAEALKIETNKLISIQHFQPISKEHNPSNIFDCFIPPKDFGSKVKNLRVRENISQKELARQLGLNRETIRRYENNITRPRADILRKIATILDIEYKELQCLSYHKGRHISNNFRKELSDAEK